MVLLIGCAFASHQVRQEQMLLYFDPLELWIHLHSIFERVDNCASHPSPWCCGRKIPHSSDTSLMPLPISNSWATWSERFGWRMQNHLTQLQSGKHLLSDFRYFDPKLSQGHWMANACHLLHKIHNVHFLIRCEHTFLPLSSSLWWCQRVDSSM